MSTPKIPNIPIGIPKMAYDYLDEAKACLGNRTYKAVILISAASIESYLKQMLPYVENVLSANKKVKNMSFSELIDWARIAGFLTNKCWQNANEVRQRRNDLIHPDEYSKIVNKNKLMRKISDAISIESPNYTPNDLPRIQQVKDNVAFKVGLPKFSEETYSLAFEVIELLHNKLFLFLGLRESIPPNLIIKYKIKT